MRQKGESWASSPTVRKVMLSNRSTGTSPEVTLWSALRRAGIKFRKNFRALPGSPDAFVEAVGLAVFVDGDFWHGRNGTPKTNRAFWRRKFAANRARDARVRRRLNGAGVRVMRVWESDLKRRGVEWLTQRIERRL